MSYDNSKQVIVRKVVSDKANAPTLSVEFEMNGQKYRAGLWAWTRKDGTPVVDKNGNAMYKGVYEEDNYAQEVQNKGMEEAKAAMAPATDFDDQDIPF